MARNPFKPLETVSLEDPALDLAKCSKMYPVDLDPAGLKFLDGKKPRAVFHLGLIDGNYYFRAVESLPRDDHGSRLRAAFLAGCHTIVTESGTKTASTSKEAYDQLVADNDWFTECCSEFGTDVVSEMGYRIIRLQKLPASMRPTSSLSVG